MNLFDLVLSDDLTSLKKEILNGADVVHVKDKYEQTLLHYAVAFSSLEIIKCLLEHKVDINAKLYNGNTPLNCAILHDKLVNIEYLLENGADINMKNNDGFTPLQIAKIYQQKQAIETIDNYLMKIELWNCWHIE